MKPLARTILIWLLSLSLTGLPVLALSQDITSLDLNNKNMSMQPSTMKVEASQGKTEHCHSDVLSGNAKMSGNTKTPAPMAAETGVNTSEKCCCDTGCQCQHDMACQTSHITGTTAILQITQYFYTPSSSQLVTESTVCYQNCVGNAEIIPPIV